MRAVRHRDVRALAAQMRKDQASMWARARCWALWMAVIALEASDDALLASMNRRIADEVIAGVPVGGRS